MVSGETFHLVQDEHLDMLKTVPAPKPDEFHRYYESPDYISHTDAKRGLMPRLYQLVKKWSIQKKVELIHAQNSGVGSLLDVGAGTGDFLKAAKEKGWDVYGMEPNRHASVLASTKKIELKESLKEFEEKQFDVVTLWHVLEHIPNLEETVLQLASLVKPSGILIVAVPNFRSYDAHHYGRFWAAYDAPRHLWHFSKNSIARIFEGNFRLIKTIPMIFDAFYVSLLSEKYKNGNSFSLRALWVGLKSNWLAYRSKEYSSHIYCFKKG